MSIFRTATIAALALVFSTAVEARTISLKTTDSVTLSADHKGTGERGVVLVHANGGDRAGWADIAEVLSDNGLQVVALDLRGHGASKGDADPLKMTADVQAAAKYLQGRGVKHVTVVGARLGGNLALAAAATDESIEQVVMISPALNANGVKVSTALKGFGDRKLMLIAGDDDTLSKKAVNLIAKELDGSTVRILESGGSGMTLVNRASDLETILLGFAADNKAAQGDLSQDLKAGEGAENLETTGTKLGER